jgi:hypothetical protein
MCAFDKHLLADEIPANSWFTVDISKIIYLKKNEEIQLIHQMVAETFILEVYASRIHVVQILLIKWKHKAWAVTCMQCKALHMDGLQFSFSLMIRSTRFS